MIQRNNELIAKLINLGLKDKEAQVYLALAKFDKVGVAKIAQETGLTKQNLYNYFDLLRNKNLIGELMEKGKRVFFAKEVKDFKQSLLKTLQEKMQLAELIHNEVDEYRVKFVSSINYHKGRKKIQRLFTEQMKRQKWGAQEFSIEAYSQDFSFMNSLMQDKFHLYENVRVNRKVRVYPLLVVADDWDMEEEIGDEDNRRQYNETRIIKLSAFGFSASYLWEDRVWILIRNRDEYELIEIINKEVLKSYMFYFDLLWQQATLVYKTSD